MKANRTGGTRTPVLALLLTCLVLAACAPAAAGRPSVWIDYPADGARLPAGAPVEVLSHAYSDQGVVEVVLSVDGAPYRRDPPSVPGGQYGQVSQEWVPEGAGVYAVQVVAYDAAGRASGAETITVIVEGEASAPPPAGATETPTPVVTASAVATGTATQPPPAQSVVQFWAEPAGIQAGACTTIRWHVENVSRVVFGGLEQPFDGSYQACLCSDERYTLTVVHLDGSEERRSIEIAVSGSCVTETSPPPPQDTTPPPVPGPSVPENGLVLSCRTSQTLAWLPVVDPSGIAGYYVKLEQEVTKGNWVSAGGYGPVSGKQVTATVSCGGIYRWMVRAEDGAGNVSGWSSPSYFSINID